MVEIALKTRAVLGEGPTWDPRTGVLTWVDILACEVHAFTPASGADAVRRLPQHVGAAKPRAGGGLVLNLRDGIALLDPDVPAASDAGPDDGLRWLVRWPIEGRRGNDAGVDPWGRLWAGTMSYDEAPGGGGLYRVGPDGTVHTVLEAVTISNGIGWSPDRRRMYYNDSPTQRIDVFDVDPDTGLVSGRRPLAHVERGFPDGLTVDADGCVWVAVWDGGAVHRYTPDGELDRVVELPVTRPTACAFGGPDLSDLYITTAAKDLDETALAAQPLAGALFVLPGAGTGLPTTPFAG